MMPEFSRGPQHLGGWVRAEYDGWALRLFDLGTIPAECVELGPDQIAALIKFLKEEELLP